MAATIEEILYPALEDYELDRDGQGPAARSVKVPLQPFTLIIDDARRAPDAAAGPLRTSTARLTPTRTST